MPQRCSSAIVSLVILVISATSFGQKPQLSVQTGHAKQVLSVAFTRDGRIVASGSVDQTIKLWDPATGFELRALKGHTGTVNCVVFSPDDRVLASSSADNTIKLWEVASGRELRTFRGHTLFVWSIAFSQDGRTIISGSGDQSVKLWDVATGRELKTIVFGTKAQLGMGINVAFSPDGKTMAAGGDVVRIYDAATERELHTLRPSAAGRPYIQSPIAFSVDGKALMTGGNTIKIWDVASGRELRTIEGDSQTLAMSADGRTLASGDRTTIKLWNATTGTAIREIEGPKVGVETVAFSADGKTLATGNGDNTIILIEAATGRELRVLKGHASAVTSLALSADGRTLANGNVTSIGRFDPIRIWDPSTGQLLRALTGQSFVAYSIAMNADGNRLISGSIGNTVRMWDVSTGEQVKQFVGATERFVPDRAAFSADGRFIAAGGRNNMIRIWEAASGRELFTLRGHTKGIRDLAFSPDGKTLASASQDTTIKLWSVESGREIETLSGTSAGITAVVFSPDGTRLATGSQDNLLLSWNISANGVEGVFEGHRGWVNAVAYSRDGKKLASGSEDGEVMLWDVASNKPLHTMRGHSGRVNSVIFSADDSLVISGSDDTTMKLWDVATGTEIASLIEIDHQDWLVVTPDGLFDGSPAAWNQILWRFSANLFDVAPVELFFNEYYHPGLLADLYAGKRPKATQNIALRDRRQPSLKLSMASGGATEVATRRVALRIDIASAPAGAQDVRLFRNGSLAKSWRGDVMKGLNSVTLSADVSIVAGENRFTAYAFNRDNVKSADATLAITGAESLKREGVLYILAIAVNKYANSQFDLRYAVADAADFATEMQRQETKLRLHARVEVIPLNDAEATKAGILRATLGLAGRVQPEDTVVVYFAGHGTAHQNQFYLIPHDLGYRGDRARIDAAALQTILARSISDRELELAFEGIDAGRFLFVIDACNSGQALEAEEKRRGPMNSRGLAQLAYEKGIYILTAAQSYQAALEPTELKHGLLTYALVEEGLKTAAADTEPRDGVLFVREWLNYAMKRVPQIQSERMRQAGTRGRKLAYIEGEENKDVANRNIQRPRVFYRRELETQPFIVARP